MKIETLSDAQTARIYDDYMNATKNELTLSTSPELAARDPIELRLIQRKREGYEAIPGSNKMVFCWAIDTRTFLLKPPCVRCQRMYSGWVLHLAPGDTASKKTALREMTGRTIAYNKGMDTCSYCAETTAAAKLYLLRNGKMALS